MGVLDFITMNSQKSQPEKPSRKILISLVSAGIILLILAVSVGQLTLDEGYTIPLGESTQDGAPVNQSIPAGEAVEIVLRALIALSLIALPIYIIQSLFSKKGRKRLIADIIIIGVAFLMLQCASNQELEEDQAALEEIATEFDALGDPFEVPVNSAQAEPIPELPEEAPPWANTVIAILLVVLVGGGVAAVYIIIRRRRAQPVDDSLERVADQAEDALRKIRAGGDFNSAILNCYYEMNRIVQEEMKVFRQRTMTARDFESYLVEKGLPQKPLEELTGLFERARYSNQPPDQQQEQTAINALTSLITTVHDLAVPERKDA